MRPDVAPAPHGVQALGGRRSLTGWAAAQHSDRVHLALAVLAGTGYVTLLLELPRLMYPVEAAALGALYVLVAVLGFRWVDRQEARRRRIAAAAYIPVLFVLGYLT